MLSFDWVRRLIAGYNGSPHRGDRWQSYNTADDLIEVLTSDEKVRSAVRRELLTEELLKLPDRFDKMLETQTSVLEDIKGLRGGSLQDLGSNYRAGGLRGDRVRTPRSGHREPGCPRRQRVPSLRRQEHRLLV